MSQLQIIDLHVSVDDKEILKGVNLTVNTGEIHALMGPNGNGKSTLLMSIMGHPKYKVTQGQILFDGIDVTKMSVDQRSRAGLFLALQYPLEVNGVTNSDFLKAAVNAHSEQPVKLFSFIRELDKAISDVKLKEDTAHRFVNEGFSGGEKKRNEIIQMKLLKPKMAMLDEIDSGLDVDALKIISDNILDLCKTNPMGLIIVSHYERFYDLVTVTHAHILVDGRIVESGDASLAKKIDQEGYSWVLTKYNIKEDKKEDMRISLGTCAVNKGNKK